MSVASNGRGRGYEVMGASRDGQGPVEGLPPFGGGGAQPPQTGSSTPGPYPLPGDDPSRGHDIGGEPPSSN